MRLIASPIVGVRAQSITHPSDKHFMSSTLKNINRIEISISFNFPVIVVPRRNGQDSKHKRHYVCVHVGVPFQCANKLNAFVPLANFLKFITMIATCCVQPIKHIKSNYWLDWMQLILNTGFFHLFLTHQGWDSV